MSQKNMTSASTAAVDVVEGSDREEAATAPAEAPRDKLDRKTLLVFVSFCVALVVLVALNMK